MENEVQLAMILFLGIFVQSSAGFAAGLIIVPSLLWCGFTIPEAQASLLVATVPQNIAGVWTLRQSIPVRRIALPGLVRIVFFPIGCFLLVALQAYPIDRVKQVVGGVVLLATLAIIWWKPIPRKSLHRGWDCIAFPISGLLQGLVGMGGPPMVFWVQSHDWTPREMRGFLFAMYLISLVPAGIVLYVFFGDVIVRPAIAATLTLPLLLLATYLGLKFGDWLGRERLRSVTLGLLLVIGISGLLSPYLPLHDPQSNNAPAETISR